MSLRELGEHLDVVLDYNAETLARLAACKRARTAVRDHEADLVKAAIENGASWAAIARALGITRQAAHLRYCKWGDRASS